METIENLKQKKEKIKASLKQTLELKRFLVDDCRRMNFQLAELEKEINR